MINIRSILKLANNDGLTLKGGKPIIYKTGYQVATEGIECHTAREAINAVKEYKGNCGVWFFNNCYFVDRCHRVSTKKAAIEEGRAHSQISIFNWKKQDCVYL